MKVIVCGSRHWTCKRTICKVLDKLMGLYKSYVTIVHGGCRGADRIAGIVAQENGFPTVVFPADWSKHGRAAGPIRNAEMLAAGADLVLAFHDDENLGRGTADMVRRAMAADVPVMVFTSGEFKL